VAALDILGLLGLIETALNRIGFPYGTTRISGLNVVRALIVLAFMLWLSALARRFLERRISQTQTLSPSLQALLLQFSNLVLPALAVVIALPVLGLNLTALTVFGGAFAVGAGLGLQKIIANLVSGFLLLGTKAIKPGDIIALKDTGGNPTYGRISAIGANFVSLRTRAGIEYLVPNETLLTSSVESWTYSDTRIRLKVPFTVVYNSDLRRAMSLAVEAVQAVPRILKDPKPVCLLKNLGAGAIEMELRLWIDDPMNGVANVRSECLLLLWDYLKAHGIQMPIPGPTSVVLMQPAVPNPVAPKPA
jgi:small-conductance mechanosensitive channel